MPACPTRIYTRRLVATNEIHETDIRTMPVGHSALPVSQCKHSGMPIKGWTVRKGRGCARGKRTSKEEKFEHLERKRSDARLKKEGGKALWAAGICMASPLLSPTIKADRNPALLPPCIAFAVVVVVVTLCRRLIFILWDCTVTTTIAVGLGIIECASIWRQRDLIPLPRHKRKLRRSLSLKREGSAITETIGLEEGVAISSYRSRLWRRGTRDEKKDATQRDRNVANLIQFDEAGSAFCWHEQMLNVRYIGDSLIRSSF